MDDVDVAGIPFGGMTLVNANFSRQQSESRDQHYEATSNIGFEFYGSENDDDEEFTLEQSEHQSNRAGPSSDNDFIFKHTRSNMSLVDCDIQDLEAYLDNCGDPDDMENQRLANEYMHFLASFTDETIPAEDDDASEADESYTSEDLESDSDIEEHISRPVSSKECMDLQGHAEETNSASIRINSFVASEEHKNEIRLQLTGLLQSLIQIHIIASCNQKSFKNAMTLSSLMINRLLDERVHQRQALPLPPQDGVLLGRHTQIVTRSAWQAALPTEISIPTATIDIPALILWTKDSPVKHLREAYSILGLDNVNPAYIPPYAEQAVPKQTKTVRFTPGEDSLLKLGLQKFGYARSSASGRNVMSPLAPDWDRICLRFVPGRKPDQARVRYKTLFKKGEFVKGEFNSAIASKTESVHLSEAEYKLACEGVARFGHQWSRIVKEYLPHRDRKMVRREFLRLSGHPNRAQASSLNDDNHSAAPSACDGATTGSQAWSTPMDDAAAVVHAAPEMSSIHNSSLTSCHIMPPEFDDFALHDLTLPDEPCWTFTSAEEQPALPSPCVLEVRFDKTLDREILTAAKLYGANINNWPLGSCSLLKHSGYQPVIKARLKLLGRFLAQRTQESSSI
uniref:Myb-like domain-containing protein n=1 Tax=Spongospora subterranea TaxID=70186 RepID=A0A0H5RPS8_9EUKA|eukprot:CRZ10729.1 hypothetical protein [Spongospora subterranea]